MPGCTGVKQINDLCWAWPFRQNTRTNQSTGLSFKIVISLSRRALLFLAARSASTDRGLYIAFFCLFPRLMGCTWSVCQPVVRGSPEKRLRDLANGNIANRRILGLSGLAEVATPTGYLVWSWERDRLAGRGVGTHDAKGQPSREKHLSVVLSSVGETDEAMPQWLDQCGYRGVPLAALALLPNDVLARFVDQLTASAFVRSGFSRTEASRLALYFHEGYLGALWSM